MPKSSDGAVEKPDARLCPSGLARRLPRFSWHRRDGPIDDRVSGRADYHRSAWLGVLILGDAVPGLAVGVPEQSPSMGCSVTTASGVS